MYERHSRLTTHQQSELIKLFVAGVTARAASELIIIQTNTVSNFFLRLRKLIASKVPSYDLSGEIEVDDSYFGGVHKGKQGAGPVVAIFDLLKRGGKVYTAIISNTKKLFCLLLKRKSALIT